MSNSASNTLVEPKRPNIFTKFLYQFQDFMILTLLGASVVSLLLSTLEGHTDFMEPGIILAIVIINAALGVLQESKAERSLEALKKLSAPHAIILKHGKRKKIPSEQVAVGDTLYLEAGNYVCADARVTKANVLSTEESALTGETIEVIKDTTNANRVFSGTTVATGHGEAVVTAIGMDTEIGHIAAMITEEAAPITPLGKRLTQIGKTLGIITLAICGLLFAIGLLKSYPPFALFMTTVSLAVAAIPEGLPAIVTIMLSLGVERMAKKNAIIRKLPAVETLGSATVICSDKTGTLTEGRMQLVNSFDYDEGLTFLRYAVLCNNETSGVEAAILRYAEAKGMKREREQNRCPLLHEIPFNSTRKRMTTLHRDGSSYLSITKGAFEYILDRCSSYYDNGVVRPLSPSIRQSFTEANHDFATHSLRVLAIAYRTHEHMPQKSEHFLESKLILCGLLGFMDPPRQEAITAVRECQRAGIRPVMITGDHALTAAAVGEAIGLSHISHDVITGETLASFSDDQLYQHIYEYPVFARVTPTDKVRIVKAFQKHGEVVAMTGDGVNDAPALKIADIGCAMGKCGTDVAKSAADMVLMDDNFATIVSAVREGRGIYDNVKKAIHFLISCNIGEIMTIFLAIAFGLASPLAPIQLLFINLVTDSFPAISLGMEKPEPDIMNRKPRGMDKHIFSKQLYFEILMEGLMIGALALFAYAAGCRYSQHGFTSGRTMCFAVLALSQLTHSLNTRSSYPIFKIGLLGNVRLMLSIVLGTGLVLATILTPTLSTLFQTIPLSLYEWGFVIGLSLLPLPLVELQKNLRKK